MKKLILISLVMFAVPACGKKNAAKPVPEMKKDGSADPCAGKTDPCAGSAAADPCAGKKDPCGG